MEKNSNPYSWITFIGLILLLLGIYSSARTAINLAFFSKYPTSGVLSMPFGMPAFYGPREEDCMMIQAPPPYPGNDNFPGPSVDEQKNSCMQGVLVAREQAKVADLSQSVLFLFLGAGVLLSRKHLFS